MREEDKLNKKSVLIILLCTLLALTMLFIAQKTTTNASSTANVYINPSVESVNKGQNFTIYIAVSGATNIAGWQAGLTFDPHFLECLNFQEDQFLKADGTTTWLPGTINNTKGIVSFSACVLNSGQTVSGNGNLANVTFHCIAPGTSTINLTDVILVDPSPPTPQAAPVTTTDGTVTTTVGVVGVGGVVVPVDKLALSAPYIGLASTIIVATVAAAVCVKRVKRRKEKQ